MPPCAAARTLFRLVFCRGCIPIVYYFFRFFHCLIIVHTSLYLSLSLVTCCVLPERLVTEPFMCECTVLWVLQTTFARGLVGELLFRPKIECFPFGFYSVFCLFCCVQALPTGEGFSLLFRVVYGFVLPGWLILFPLSLGWRMGFDCCWVGSSD